ncbi:MAG TPA: tetratricopeptide repeat protein [Gammaproteobacteria bacterium]|nr:tetratricopeptide repeat protein [Gammaproteobacteria bacterium]
MRTDGPENSSVPPDLKEAIAAHKAGDLDAAAPRYREYLARDPANPTALQLLGLLHSQKGEYETAITYMQESLRRFPHQAEVANNLGIALMQLGRTNEALEGFKQAVTLVPRFSLAWRNIGLCQLRQRNFAPAQAALKRCLEIDSGDAAAWLGLANTWKRQDKPEKAIAYLQKAIEARPDYAAAYHNLGVCLRLTGQSGQAIEHYKTALRLGLKRPELYQNLGNALTDTGDFKPAIEAYREALALDPGSSELKQLLAAAEAKRQTDTNREAELCSLLESYLATRRPQDAVVVLMALTREVPDSLYYFSRLAALLEGLGRMDEAITHYRRLLERQPDNAVAWFNLALLCKRQRRYAEARGGYENALRHGIDDPEEVYSNLGVLYSDMRQAGQAEAMYCRALEENGEYIPALFNLAGLYEEADRRQEAMDLYRQILNIDTKHREALTRLVRAQRLKPESIDLLEALRRAIEEETDPAVQEGLHFALGKALDDQGLYTDAFAAYREANRIGRSLRPPYRREVTEQAFSRLIELFNPAWIERNLTGSKSTPVFICGMFRSGSTLIEQVLAGHPEITPGGELDILPWLITQRLSPFPEAAVEVSRQVLTAMGGEYLAALHELFPEAGVVTDKRPDNFLFLGLVKAMFPQARIIYTRRNPLDNCLSIYFQQLGGNLNYATDLGDTAHYYRQHSALMAHWQSCFGKDIFTVDYDGYVTEPEPVLRRLLDFLGLEWNDACLGFTGANNLVKTASVWQVREGLHRESSGRWRNYAAELGDLRVQLEEN